MVAPLTPREPVRLSNGARPYVEVYGASLALNATLKTALLCVSVVAIAMLVVNVRALRRLETFKPLVIRIDEVGRAQALAYDAMTYAPVGQAPELKYFLVQFVTKHFGRIRTTTRQQYAESLYFLDGALADATMAKDQQDHALEQFLAGAGEEVAIEVRNVTLGGLAGPTYTAGVDFDRVVLDPNSLQERRRESAVAHITFVVRDQVPNAIIPVNPLGLAITSIRVDQAFR